MKRTIVNVSAALLLLGIMLYSTQAQATAGVDCSGLRLTKASGIPGSSTHNYAFEGICKLDDPNPKKNVDDYRGTGEAVATARWDGNSHTFTEHVHLIHGIDTQKITHGGSLFSSSTYVNKGPHVGTGAEDATFSCNVDPVIHKGAVCTLVSHYNAMGWGNQSGGFAVSAVLYNTPPFAGPCHAGAGGRSVQAQCQDQLQRPASDGCDGSAQRESQTLHFS
jgi:hypothetical protein